jgi:hypothetical protein
MVTALPVHRPAFEWAEPPPGARPPEDLRSPPELAAAGSRPGGAWLLVDRGRQLMELSSLARELGLKFKLRQVTLHTFVVHLERAAPLTPVPVPAASGSPAPGPEAR